MTVKQQTSGRPPLRVAREGDDPRPVIRLGVELAEVVAEAIEALRSDQDLYERDQELVHVVRATELDAAKGHGLPPETPTIRRLHAATLRARLTVVARWKRFDMRTCEWVPAIPTDHVVNAVLRQGQWPGLRTIAGVIEAPALRPDGSILDRPGYDAPTGFLYFPNATY